MKKKRSQKSLVNQYWLIPTFLMDVFIKDIIHIQGIGNNCDFFVYHDEIEDLIFFCFSI